MEKIKLEPLNNEDLHVISDATSKYSEALSTLCASDNLSQQHIHFSIIQFFSYDIFRRITKIPVAKNPVLNMEIHTAFVVYDALQFYSNLASGKDAAIIRRLIIQLFALLPFTRDHQQMSLHSKLNFHEED